MNADETLVQRRLRQGLVAGLMLLLLGIWVTLARAHPSLRFPDFVGFSARASALPARWMDELYPVGYPALLRALHPLVGDSLISGRAISVLAGVLGAFASAKLGGGRGAAPEVLVALLTMPAVLAAGATEGTDMLAASLGLAALWAADRDRALVAGLLVGLGCLTRYQAVVVLLPVWVLIGAPRRIGWVMTGFLTVTSLHWAPGLVSGGLWPAGGPHAVGSPWARLPGGLLAAGSVLFHEPAAWIGLLGLGVGLRRRPRLVLSLLFAVGSHLVLLALFFSNPRLMVPAWLWLTPGVGLLAEQLPGRRWWWLGLVPLGLGVASGILKKEAEISPAESSVAAVSALADTLSCPGATAGCWYSNNPWFYVEQDGYLLPAVQITSFAPPGTLTPAAFRAKVTAGVLLALDAGRKPTMDLDPVPEGYELVGKVGAWKVWRVGE